MALQKSKKETLPPVDYHCCSFFYITYLSVFIDWRWSWGRTERERERESVPLVAVQGGIMFCANIELLMCVFRELKITTHTHTLPHVSHTPV